MQGQFDHVPVMGREVVELFLPVPTGLIVDATVGGGGHAALLLDARPDLRLLGVDRDADAVAAARDRLGPYGDRAQVVQARFGELRDAVSEHDEGDVIAVLFDLGVSSAQLDRPERGFSYRFDAPLDMRMDATQSLTAAEVVNHYDEARLASVIARFGEERFANRIAAAIVAARPIDGTRELAEIVKIAIPAATRRRGPHPARRTFQAIRMEVNQELPDLAAGLDDAVHLVGPGGRIQVLAYHSLEDRIVKERFVGESRQPELPSRLPVRDTRPATPFRLITRRALRPTPDEVAANPRAESAPARRRAPGEYSVIMTDPRHAAAIEYEYEYEDEYGETEVDLVAAEYADVVVAEYADGDLDGTSASDVAVEALVVDALAIDVIEAERNLERDRHPERDPNRRRSTEPVADPTPERHLRIAPDSVRRRRHVRIAAAAAAVSISATLFAVVGFNVELAQHQIQLQKLQSQLQTEQTKYYDLRDEVAQRSSPAQIVREAAKRGLVPEQPTYLSANVKLPHQDRTGLLGRSLDTTGSSLDNPVP